MYKVYGGPVEEISLLDFRTLADLRESLCGADPSD